MYPTLHFFGLVGSMPHPPPTRTRHTSHETQGARARGPCHCMLAPTRTNPARSVSFAYFHVMFTIFSWNSFTYLKFLNGNAITLISTISRSRNFFLLHLNTSCQIDSGFSRFPDLISTNAAGSRGGFLSILWKIDKQFIFKAHLAQLFCVNFCNYIQYFGTINSTFLLNRFNIWRLNVEIVQTKC